MMNNKKNIVITIDGLSINGKTTLAKMLSDSLNIKYFNTGAVYRCLSLYVIENNLNIDNLEEILPLIKKLKIDFINGDVYLNNVNVQDKIKTEEISYYSAKWATIPEIKDAVCDILREFIKYNDVIMEGRDIGVRVAPNADIKFVLYSDFETRLNRLFNRQKNIDKEELRSNLKKRDDLDINKGNFVKPENAIEIDTTNYNLNEVHEIMLSEINKIID